MRSLAVISGLWGSTEYYFHVSEWAILFWHILKWFESKNALYYSDSLRNAGV